MPPRLVLAFLALLLAACAGEPEVPRNLLVISVDTLRADALGASGYEGARTPHLDRLAAGGVYFTQAIAPVPRTTPALASLLTGTDPHRHGSREVGDPIGEVTTLAEVLRRQGFVTLAVSANRSAGPKENLDRGFDRFVTHQDLMARHRDLYLNQTRVSRPEGQYWAAATTQQALELIDGAATDRPYFLWLFYFDPHFLYRPPSPWQDTAGGDACWQLYEEWKDRRTEAGQVFADVHGVASAVAGDCRHLYDAVVAYVDDQIGRLLEGLRERGRLDDTLIVFTADHGENFGEGGLFFEHGDNAHDAALRVPLVFHGPGLAAGRRDDGAVGLIDVAPTVLSLLAVPESERPPADGVDLSGRLRPGAAAEPRERRRILFAESAGALWNEATGRLVTGTPWWRVCINGPRYTLCKLPREKPGAVHLYDHVDDPALSRDIAAEHPEAVAELEAAWTVWPPESARERVARTSDFKLVERPRLDGTYEATLYHLPDDPGEEVDVRDRYPEVFDYLKAALDRWTAQLPEIAERPEDPELEARLRSLGYLP